MGIGYLGVKDLMILMFKDNQDNLEGDSMIGIVLSPKEEGIPILNKEEGILWSEEEENRSNLEWIHIIEMTSLVLPTITPTTWTKTTTKP